MKKNWYAVRRGIKMGLFTDWWGPNGAEAMTQGVSGAVHQGFSCRVEAVAYLLQDAFDCQPFRCTSGIRRSATELVYDIDRKPTGSRDSGGSTRLCPVLQYEGVDDFAPREVGRWGEHFAYIQLKARLGIPDEANTIGRDERGSVIAEICWNNETSESGQSYDIKTVVGGVEKFYEVKSSSGKESNRARKFSECEVAFARKMKDRWSVLVVLGAGSPQAEIFEFENRFATDPLVDETSLSSVVGRETEEHRRSIEFDASTATREPVVDPAAKRAKPTDVQKEGSEGVSNLEFASHNHAFTEACDLAGIPPTARQASRYRNGRGLAYATKRRSR